MMIVVCWQAWRGTRQEFAVGMNKGRHDVELRNLHLGYNNSWDFSISHCLFGFGYCTVLMLEVRRPVTP
jgi:hypothetical protein